MTLIATTIPDVVLVETKIFTDERGSFYESWNQQEMIGLGVDHRFVQDNFSQSRKGVLRGLHYQIRHPQGKLVRVVAGEVFDVAVDLRKSSPTFGKWVGFVLSGESGRMAWIPPGFAHGFYVLSQKADLLYKTTDHWYPQFERTLLWNDSTIGIDWPLEGRPLLAAKDQEGTSFSEVETFD